MKLQDFNPKQHLKRWNKDACIHTTKVVICEGNDKFEVYSESILDEYVARNIYSVVERLKQEGKTNLTIEYIERKYKPHKKLKFLGVPHYRTYQTINVN